MQIKEFYLDLKEGPQYAKKNHGNVWLLESEAFSEPLRFTFKFENEDLKEFQKIEEKCRNYYDLILKKESTFNNIVNGLIEKEKKIQECYEEIKELSEKYDKILLNLDKNKELIKEKTQKENEKINILEKEIKLIDDKISLPQPQKVYSNTWEEFVTGTDLYYCYPYLLPNGNYYILEQYEYEPQNEYVMNQNKILIKEQYISEKYIPNIQLESSNLIDKPVSKVRLTVLFFQI